MLLYVKDNTDIMLLVICVLRDYNFTNNISQTTIFTTILLTFYKLCPLRIICDCCEFDFDNIHPYSVVWFNWYSNDTNTRRYVIDIFGQKDIQNTFLYFILEIDNIVNKTRGITCSRGIDTYNIVSFPFYIL